MDHPFRSDFIGGRYRLRSKLGEGGMGSVFLARDERLDTFVVVKVPHRTMLHQEGFRERFRREIRSLLKLRHPRIVSILDVGEENDLPYAVMQYLGGRSLADHRATVARLHPLQRLSSLGYWLPHIASALDFIHSQGFIHRDIKPANILFDEYGNAYLSDFGIAKVVANDEEQKRQRSLTGTGIAIGTPEYMAPELCDGGLIDERVDQYALAVTAYEVLTGNCPFIGPTPLATIVMHKTHEPLPLKSILNEIPATFSDLLARGMAKSPRDRFPNCVALAQALIVTAQPAAQTSDLSDRSSPQPKDPSQKSQAQRGNFSGPGGQAGGSNDGMRRELCPHCGMIIKTPNDQKLVGRRAVCPRCRMEFVITGRGWNDSDGSIGGGAQASSESSSAATRSSSSSPTDPAAPIPARPHSPWRDDPGPAKIPNSVSSAAVAQASADGAYEPAVILLTPDTTGTAVSDTDPIPLARPATPQLTPRAAEIDHYRGSEPVANFQPTRKKSHVGLWLSFVFLMTLLTGIALVAWFWSLRLEKRRELNELARVWENELFDKGTTQYVLEEHAPESFDQWLQMAKSGDRIAQMLVADCYLMGVAVEKDPEEAFRWFGASADQGVELSQIEVARAYLDGEGVEQDRDKGLELLQELADQDYGYAIYWLASQMPGAGAGSTQEREAYAQALTRGVTLGDQECQYELGNCYASGRGVPRDLNEAARLYRLSAEQGDARAQYQLAQAYRLGSGVELSHEESFRWFSRAAENEHDSAQLMVGNAYAIGRGVTQDPAQAAHWFRAAAEHDNAVAQFQLGVCYETGNGVPMSISDAIDWYTQAKNNGHKEAEQKLESLTVADPFGP